MRHLILSILILGTLTAALPAAAQSLDLTMTTDLYCNDPPVSGTLSTGWNVATVPNLCGGTVMTGGNADAYGVNLLVPSQVTVTTVSSFLEVTMLQSPYTANDCVANSTLMPNPTVTACLPPGYYSILLSSPLRVLTPYEVSVTCTPCEPVAVETAPWGSLKGSFR
ncbi:MAG: hypothetical protein IPO18_08690 [bacterium]|nr:hypothetical protein [bacterium]